MNWNLISGILLFLIFMGPALILISTSLRETKNENKSIVKLKINYVEVFFYCLLYFLLFAFVWGLVFFKIKSWNGILLFSPLLFLSSIDFIIIISHTINYSLRTIYWNKTSNKLEIKGLLKNFEINLDSENVSIVNYYPPIKGSAGKGFPGFAFDVLKISDKNNSIKISNLEYFDYNLKMKLGKQKNYIEKKRQFNIII